jgi:glycosyltransferase involved in cell wall biosynthesis
MSNSVMEAMASGVPVVASDIPPNRELLVDGETGYLIRVGDSVGMAQFTDRILADPSLAQRLGAAGRDRMRTDFSIDRMVAAHAELYRAVLRT